MTRQSALDHFTDCYQALTKLKQLLSKRKEIEQRYADDLSKYSGELQDFFFGLEAQWRPKRPKRQSSGNGFALPFTPPDIKRYASEYVVFLILFLFVPVFFFPFFLLFSPLSCSLSL